MEGDAGGPTASRAAAASAITVPAPAWTIRIVWTALAACASTLLLAITNHLSQNVAPIPFLWVLPLAVYLLSFILCFERDKVYNRGVFLPLLVIALDGAAYAIYANEGNPNIAWAIPTFVAALFVCCMVCHGELARLKPDPAPPHQLLSDDLARRHAGRRVRGHRRAARFSHLPRAAARRWWPAARWPPSFCGSRLKIGKARFRSRAVRIAMLAFTVGLAIHLGYEKHRSDRSLPPFGAQLLRRSAGSRHPRRTKRPPLSAA